VRSLALLLALAASMCLGVANASAANPTIKHVWIVVLENKSYDTTFGSSPGSAYLGTTLPAQGQLLTQYFGIGHSSLDNYIAMISGQPPDTQTQADCGTFSEFVSTSVDPNGVDHGNGCVYPTGDKTIADQIDAAPPLTWKAYMEDMGISSPGRAPLTSCDHPDIGQPDHTETAAANDQYATKHNPFVYFHSIIDDQPKCGAHVVDLSQLDNDLTSASTTPSYSFITPDLCSDGHDSSCADGTSPGGYAGIDNFLSTWIPKIKGSAAYADGGLIIVTFDEADASKDATSCCSEPASPNTPHNGGGGDGGGRTGAVLLSPSIMAGTKNDTPYNHYSMLRSVEDFFGLSHLGYASQDGLQPFGSEVFDAKPTPTDRDGDGVPDSSDACPDTAAATANGCPAPTDIDGDGVPDSSDACPTVAAATPNGCPDPKPVVKITGVPKKCVRHAFKAKVAVVSKQLAGVTVTVDGHKIAKSKKHKFSVKVKVSKLKKGKQHRLKAAAKDKIARVGSKTVKFRVCR
jgi:hypothetical protein